MSDKDTIWWFGLLGGAAAIAFVGYAAYQSTRKTLRTALSDAVTAAHEKDPRFDEFKGSVERLAIKYGSARTRSGSAPRR